MENLYICDPDKNKECKKTSCQTDCILTTKKEYEKKLSPHWNATTCYARTDNGMLLYGYSCSECGKVTYISSSIETPVSCPFCQTVMRRVRK